MQEPFDDIDIKLEKKDIMYLVVEKDTSCVFPKIRGVFTEAEYEQAKANAAPVELALVGVIGNRMIREEEISYVED